MYAICDTSGCGNQGIPVALPPAAEIVVCGVCSQPITVFTDTAPEPITEVPEWLL